MSSHDQAVAALLAQIALAADGAILGLATAYLSIRTLIRYSSSSSSLKRISTAPSLQPSDLRSILPQSDGPDLDLIVVRGSIDAKSAVDGNWMTLRPTVIVSQESGEKGVILQRTQTCIYNEWRGFLGWTSDLRSVFARSRKETESSSLRMVPFILVDSGRRSQTDYVSVNTDGSKHSLPLTTVYHQLQPINVTTYTFLEAFFGHQYPVGLLDEEKILPLGKDITVVGICSLKNGIYEIKSCHDLPYFLSDMTKDQMVLELAYKTDVLLWTGIILGSLSAGILAYAAIRNWHKWKAWRHQRQQNRDSVANTNANSQVSGEDDSAVVFDGELCVVCLMRRRRSAFIPCGHFVCCQRCALSVERDVIPKCPVCRQSIRNSVRIYDS